MIRKLSYGAFWLILIILAGWGTYHTVINQPEIHDSNDPDNDPNDQVRSIVARTTRVEEMTEDGHIKWVLESVDLNGDVQGSFVMNQPKALISLDNGTRISLTAPEGEYDRPKREMHLSGGVKAIREDDLSAFHAEEIFFSANDKILKSSGGDITLMRGNWEFTSAGINIDLSGKSVIINLDEPVRILGLK